ncbi:hypothetical protein D7U74_16935 [Stenotrophomonas maltophilia]|uniref:hypothetical protein n=1 Tax=Stenotrophomonas maltophilia TaxID=40324 RepID=UPI0015DE2359|nr:hypothetical protein [Stenotrophomonas maltophilia]MBA0223233.1 hypothetical protein [Stenotrophomonas maltophilia]
MNHELADGAVQRLGAQIAEALFDQPGMTLTEQANRLRELRGDGPALLVGGSHGSEVQVADGPWPEIDAILADAYSAGAVGLPFGGIARRAAVRAALAAKAAHQPEYLHGSDELRARVEGERAAYLEGLEEGKLIAAQPSPGGQDTHSPLSVYADSYRRMAKMGDGRVSCIDVAFDIEHNMSRALAARQPVEESVEADVYCAIADMIEPYVQREGINPDGVLPASVHDSVAILLEHWVKTRQPVGEPVWQKMESAPKDGTVVLGLLEGSDIPQSIRFRDGWEIAWDAYRIPAHDGPLRWAPLCAATPAQQHGEPVAWMDPDGSRVLTAKAKADASGAYKSATSVYTVPLYPPAQAVDLAQFRQPVEFFIGYTFPGTPSRAEGERLLALIDGKAVGNG